MTSPLIENETLEVDINESDKVEVVLVDLEEEASSILVGLGKTSPKSNNMIPLNNNKLNVNGNRILKGRLPHEEISLLTCNQQQEELDSTFLENDNRLVNGNSEENRGKLGWNSNYSICNSTQSRLNNSLSTIRTNSNQTQQQGPRGSYSNPIPSPNIINNYINHNRSNSNSNSNRLDSNNPIRPSLGNNSKYTIQGFLNSLGLIDYLNIFIQEGFLNLSSLMEIQEDDFEAMRIKRGHRRIIQRSLANIRGVPKEVPLFHPTHFTPLQSNNINRKRSRESDDSPPPQSSMNGNARHFSTYESRDQQEISNPNNNNHHHIRNDSPPNHSSHSSHPPHQHQSHSQQSQQGQQQQQQLPETAFQVFATSQRDLTGIPMTEANRIISERWFHLSESEKNDLEMILRNLHSNNNKKGRENSGSSSGSTSGPSTNPSHSNIIGGNGGNNKKKVAGIIVGGLGNKVKKEDLKSILLPNDRPPLVKWSNEDGQLKGMFSNNSTKSLNSPSVTSSLPTTTTTTTTTVNESNKEKEGGGDVTMELDGEPLKIDSSSSQSTTSTSNNNVSSVNNSITIPIIKPIIQPSIQLSFGGLTAKQVKLK